jgi:hypothetical protein
LNCLDDDSALNLKLLKLGGAFFNLERSKAIERLERLERFER